MAQDVAPLAWDCSVVVPVTGTPPALVLDIKLKASTTFVKGQILEETGTPGVYQAVTATTGSPQCILPRACTTDASSNITFGPGAAGGEFGETWQTVSAYFGGAFLVSELTGIDANALAKLFARQIKNTTILVF